MYQSFDALSLGRGPSPRLPVPQQGSKSLHDAFATQSNAPPLDSATGASPFGASHLHEPSGGHPTSRLHHLFGNGGFSGADATSALTDGDYLSPPAGGVVGGTSHGASNALDDHVAMYGASPSGTQAPLGASAPTLRNSASFSYANSGPWGNSQMSFGMGGDASSSLSTQVGAQPALQLGAGPLRFGAKTPNAIGESDIIPTAIVIKNIPFNIKREQLLQVIRDLRIPVPYAFNYHFDQGIFRGLAFANFHSPAEANEVVAALNGLDVSGRKLRVEYKKVLQAGEKERIEKEKAYKRMQYAQQQGVDFKDRKKDKLAPTELALQPTVPGVPANGYASAPGSSHSPVPKDSARKPASNMLAGAPFSRMSGDPEASGDGATLDLNDAATLEIYSRVLLFKDDRMRDELAFSRNLTAGERRVVHLVAERLGLFHYTMGTNEDRHVLVTKTELSSGAAPGSGASRGFDVRGDARLSTGRSSPLDLRAKKSAPDLKRAMQGERDSVRDSEAMGRTGHSNMLSIPDGMPTRKSNSSLRGPASDARFGPLDSGEYSNKPQSQQAIFASPFDIPVVPMLARPSSVDIDRLDRYRHSPRTAPERAPQSVGHSESLATPTFGSMPMSASQGAAHAPPSAGPRVQARQHDVPSEFSSPSGRHAAQLSHSPVRPDASSDDTSRAVPSSGTNDPTPPRMVPPTITTSSTSDDTNVK